jgi:hypothetical protein
MEDSLNFLEKGRRPQLFFKWKTTSKNNATNFNNIFENGTDLNLYEKERRPQVF